MSAGSSLQQYNDIVGSDILRYPEVKDAHIDVNNDGNSQLVYRDLRALFMLLHPITLSYDMYIGRPDIINVTLTWPLLTSETVLKFDALLFFRLRLLDRVTVSMQNPIHISASSPAPGYEYHYLADIKYRSVNPISTQCM